MTKLLTRDEFREQVFARDNHKCVFCGAPAVDAHHILDRKLFPDGGYYVDNGASVCEADHMKCETTEHSVEEVRNRCNITDPVLPPDFQHALMYDKWGNIILPDRRVQGPLFQDTGVQKVLKKYLWMYENS